MMTFDEFFKKATQCDRYPFQLRFATNPELPAVVDVPTGLGKTAAVILGWLWRKRFASDIIQTATPRRLVYCLPMRVLVEQTAENAREWLRKLKNAGILDNDVHVYVLMGGEDEEDWDLHPEHEAILVGTQDMLLSRAINRGYAASRSRWPMHFGLLNTDCLWIFDEIQLMGAGLATTAQIEAFRRLLPFTDPPQVKASNGCRSVWMSATMQRDWLKTVDFAPRVDGLPSLELNGKDHAHDQVKKRWEAKKPLVKAKATMGEAAKIASEVQDAHKPDTRTIVVVNTVKRACELFEALNIADGSGSKKGRKSKKTRDLEKDAGALAVSNLKMVLLHSRFRPVDRKTAVKKALDKPPEEGTIVVSTQVIEAGVDVSATTLFTELAPWASLVQRFGRCNRGGEDKGAQVFWIGLPSKIADAEKLAPPYQLDDLNSSGERLKKLVGDVGLQSLPKVDLPFEHVHVIRRKDLIDLFDTTPDLAGNDIDVDRFVREVEDSDVRVFWRDYGETPNETDNKEAEPAPLREELCPALIGEFRKFATDQKRKGKIWRWSFLDKKWEKADSSKIAPGQVFLVHANAGGYSAERGWTGNSVDKPTLGAVPKREEGNKPDSSADDPTSRIGVWQTIAQHTDDVCGELDSILAALTLTNSEADALCHAARWHDCGKAHPVFQNAIDDGQVVQRKNETMRRRKRPNVWSGCRFVAKAPDKVWKDGRLCDRGFWQFYDWLPKEGRKHFRHELASALAVLDPRNKKIPDALRDRVAYLVAAHHGKVRLSIRSLPNESRPDGGRRFARGVWDDDKLDPTDLGGSVAAPAVRLSLEPMELGLCEDPPFSGQSSWAERMIRIRDELGPFRLAYLEAILRAADMRASKKAQEQAAAGGPGEVGHAD